MSKTAYLMACYAGPRLNYDYPEYVRDRLLFIRHHVEKLKQLDHNLDAIYILLNRSQTDEGYVNDYIDSLDGISIQSAIVHVIRRKNVGVSYGAYTDFFLSEEYRKYDYLIMMEDDYVPALDNFDTKMIEMLEEEPGTSFLCGMIGWGHNGGDLPHAAISNGIVRANTIALVLANNKFKHSSTQTDVDKGFYGQVTFSQAFIPHGRLRSMTDKYSVPYLRVNSMEVYGAAHPEQIIVPYQWDVAG